MPLFSKLAGTLARLTRTPFLDLSPVPTSGQASPVERSTTESFSVQAPKQAPRAFGDGNASHYLSQVMLSDAFVPPLQNLSRRRRSASLSRLESERSARLRGVRRNSITAIPCAKAEEEEPPHSATLAEGAHEKSEAEEALLQRVPTTTDLMALVTEYMALPITSKSLAGANELLAAALSARSVQSSVEAIYALFEHMQLSNMAPNEETYALVIEALCRRDTEIFSRVGMSEESSELSLAMTVAYKAHMSKQFFATTAPYNRLLQCCAYRGCSETAIAVLLLLESNLRTTKDAESYRLLLQVFMNPRLTSLDGETPEDKQARALRTCVQVFSTFERVASAMALIEPTNTAFAPAQCSSVWATMIDAYFAFGDAFGAVALLDRILSPKPGELATPPLDEQIVSRMIMGFVRTGDCRSAVQWLRQLSASSLPAPSAPALEGMVLAAMQQPSTDAANLLRDIALVLAGRSVAPADVGLAASRCVTSLATVLEMRKVERSLSSSDLSVSYRALIALAERVFAQFSSDYALRTRQQAGPVSAVLRLAAHQAVMGDGALSSRLFALATLALRHADVSSAASVSLMCDACHLPMAIADAAVANPQGAPASRFVALATMVLPALDGMSGSLVDSTATALIREYEALHRDACDLGQLSLTDQDWQRVVQMLLQAELAAGTTYPGPEGYSSLGKLLADLARLPSRVPLDIEAIRAKLVGKYGDVGAEMVAGWYESTPAPAPAPRAEAAPVPRAEAALSDRAWNDLCIDGVRSATLPPVKSLDGALSNMIHGLARPHGQLEADDLYERLQASVEKGQYPTPGALAVLINAFGRNAQVERIDELYAMAMHVLSSTHHGHDWRLQHWSQLEDGMITALSHAMLGERANRHRLRLIAAKQVPSASAYAALIATIQEHTDDAVVAEELFNESKRLGVRPTTYLYNTVISKLSRARKVDQALHLFEDMRATNLRPSSVTYGAAINACVRTGDEARATALFAEMEQQPTFQPRVPPYNTMIQYYVHSVMNREKALHFYEKMQQAGVRPSAHTYKLLLDAWGTIEPVEPDRQQSVFARLSADRLVSVQGTHWASLIHTQGVVLRNLDQALGTFESIAERAPSMPRQSMSTVPDAVVYEALFAVFVVHGRTDLMPTYLARMGTQRILPTAYIANLLIKGYAQDGPMGLVEARRVFDAMIDPPAGVAAAGNHLPRHHGAGALGMRRERKPTYSQREQAIDRANVLGALVNREPSTYEAMIRAELLFGHTDRASAILERMKARAFPAALVHRAQTLFDRA
ncbi:hypothetical protein MCAP1_002353 [Malassezia caprae]|uniref:Cytochrome c domain-containing protein n=1 Tax=Malassezia caprae TaxID=1381934 RepID=A0AAF0IVR8_9BASI|nr:hypothetical protein MCAP1_002353 [Malassezia caprae]